MQRRYHDRKEAGQALAKDLGRAGILGNAVVVALPRGGVPVGVEVARSLAAPLDIVTVKKIGAPAQSELACGAVAVDGSIVWNDPLLYSLGITQAELSRAKERALQEARKLDQALRSPSAPALSVYAKTVIVVDDGLATGATMKAALKAILLQKPQRVIVAVPVGPDDTCKEIEAMGYTVVCPLRVPEGELLSVGEWYDDFSQVESGDCRDMLEESRGHPGGPRPLEPQAVH